MAKKDGGSLSIDEDLSEESRTSPFRFHSGAENGFANGHESDDEPLVVVKPIDSKGAKGHDRSRKTKRFRYGCRNFFLLPLIQLHRHFVSGWVFLADSLGLMPGADDDESQDGDLEIVLGFLRKYLWPVDSLSVKFRVIFAFLLLLVANGLAVTVPMLYKEVCDAMDPELLANPQTVFLVVPVGLLASYMSARLISSLAEQMRGAIFAAVTFHATRSVAVDVFTHLHHLDLKYHVNRQTGGLARTVDRGTKAIGFLMDSALFTTIPSLLEIVFVVLILLFRYGLLFAIMTVFWVAAYASWTLTITQWRVRIREKMNDVDEQSTAVMIDSVLNYETVKFFNNEKMEVARYGDLLTELMRVSVIQQKSLSLMTFGQQFVCTGALTSLMYISCRGIAAGRLTVGDMVAVNGLLSQLYLPLEYMGWAFREFKQALIDIRSMTSIIRLVPNVLDQPSAPPLVVQGGGIEFDNVCFSYDGTRRVLDGVSFYVPPGRTLAIVGATGSGKSTILKLLFRFYDPTDGAVRIDGQDLREVSQQSLRARMGVVPQDCVLFNDTIFFNILYGKPESSQAEVLEAARMARIDESVQRMPERYETQVGERGVKLSGGERQRLGIARTLLKNPPILILDEATSALDSATEREITDSLKKLAEHRTTVVVAHRLSTVVGADEIIVLHYGKIAERGTHDELLLKPNGRYASMWNQQQKAPPEDPNETENVSIAD